MAAAKLQEVIISSTFSAKLVKWRICPGTEVREGSVLGFYERVGHSLDEGCFIKQPKLKCRFNGKVKDLFVNEGEIVPAKKAVAVIEEAAICEHKTVMKDLCCDCGIDLRRLQSDPAEPSSPTSASVSLLHNIPELRVTVDVAEALGKEHQEQLLKARKLALVVDLDQTLIHTTTQLVPSDMKDVHHFQLPGHPMWYHTKFRPGAFEFLHRISDQYELHIFTMGSRLYAHTIASMIDPRQQLFATRIRSRDECLNAFSKFNDLRTLFPCGDSMVCIIDDREDIWNNAPNLIQVKPYQFFKGVGDINAPPTPEDIDKLPPEPPPGELVQLIDKEVRAGTIDSGGISDEIKGAREVAKAGNDIILASNNPEAQQECDSQVLDENNLELVKQRDTNERITEPVQQTDEQGSSGNVSVVVNGDDSDIKQEKETFSQGEQNKMSEFSPCTNCVKNEKISLSEKIDTKQDLLTVVNDSSAQENGSKKDECVKVNSEETSRCVDKHMGNVVHEENDKKGVTEQIDTDIPKVETEFDHDDYLLHLEDILKGIHKTFYETADKINDKKGIPRQNPEIEMYCNPETGKPDTKFVVSQLRRGVLHGANIVFTGVIPTNVEPEESQPWRLACALGANVSNKLVRPCDTDSSRNITTHVIAARLGTEKAYHAIKVPKIQLVNPNWLWCCGERWEWVDEELFPVEGIEKYLRTSFSKGTPQSTPRGTPQNLKGKSFKDDKKQESVVKDSETPRTSSSSADFLMSSINPLLSFSSEEVEDMDKEVEELMNSSYESDVIGNISSSSSSSCSQNSSSSSSSSSSLSSPGGHSEDENGRTENAKRLKVERTRNDNLVSSRKRKRNETSSENGDSEVDDYTRKSTPSDDDGADYDDDDDDDDNDNMAAMLEEQLSHY